MRESRTYGSGRGACDETRVPTATEAAAGYRIGEEQSAGVPRPASKHGSAGLIAKWKRRSMALSADLATIFQDRDRRACELPALPTRDLV
jgi:hypothetical protein